MRRSDFLDLDELSARWDMTRRSAANKALRWGLKQFHPRHDRRVTFYKLADVHRAECSVTR